jgi:hypothetical protein
MAYLLQPPYACETTRLILSRGTCEPNGRYGVSLNILGANISGGIFERKRVGIKGIGTDPRLGRRGLQSFTRVGGVAAEGEHHGQFAISSTRMVTRAQRHRGQWRRQNDVWQRHGEWRAHRQLQAGWVGGSRSWSSCESKVFGSTATRAQTGTSRGRDGGVGGVSGGAGRRCIRWGRESGCDESPCAFHARRKGTGEAVPVSAGRAGGTRGRGG